MEFGLNARREFILGLLFAFMPLIQMYSLSSVLADGYFVEPNGESLVVEAKFGRGVGWVVRDGVVEIPQTKAMRFTPTDDTFVRKAYPEKNFGSFPDLRIAGRGGRGRFDWQNGFWRASFLKFKVKDVNSTVVRATLWLHCIRSTNQGCGLFTFSANDRNDWTERTLTFKGLRQVLGDFPMPGTFLDYCDAPKAGQRYGFNVTRIVDGDGVYCFGLVQQRGKSTWSSKEGEHAPVLELHIAHGGRRLQPIAFEELPLLHGDASVMSFTVRLKRPSSVLWMRARSINGGAQVEVFVDGKPMGKVNIPRSDAFRSVRMPCKLKGGSHVLSIRSRMVGLAIERIALAYGEREPWVQPPAQPLSKPRIWRVIDLQGRGGIPIIGDLDGDGKADYLVTGDEWILAYRNDGKLLWQRKLSGVQLECVQPWMVFRPADIDADGEVEAVGVIALGRKPHLALLNGCTGDVETHIPIKSPWLRQGFECIQIANLRGLPKPQDVVLVAKRHYKPWQVQAYGFVDGKLRLLWKYDHSHYLCCHQPKAYDIDGDGRDEVLCGNITLDDDGKVLWEIPMSKLPGDTHVDSIRVADVMPWRKGVEIAYSTAFTLLDARGRILWQIGKTGRCEGQSVAIDEFRPEVRGLELLFASQGPENDEFLYSADGRLLWQHRVRPEYDASYETYPIRWLGDAGKECIEQDWGRSRSPSFYDEFGKFVDMVAPEFKFGPIGYRCTDVTGDYRDELVCFNRNWLVTYTNTAHNPYQGTSPWKDARYRWEQINWVYY